MTYDGPRVFRAPIGNAAAQENFQRTVLDGVETSRVVEHTDREFGEETVRLWGTKATVESTWNDIEQGDFLIFYQDGVYEYAAEVTGTERNESLGRDIWPNHEEDSPWICIIYLDTPVELGVDSAEVHDLAGYDIDYPMGFSPLNEMGIGGIRGKYGSVKSFVYGDDDRAGVDVTATPHFDLPSSVLDGLYFPVGDGMEDRSGAILDDIDDALQAGKHVILTGPPGTGKTEIAQRVAAHLSETHDSIYTGFETTTATADWSTFETVGGYMPDEGGGDDLDFEPGQVLRCFKRSEAQRNDLLVIDEINRSDIDKSFGQLFTLLSGQSVTLPYTCDGTQIEVTPANRREDGDVVAHEYVMPDSWRVFATMNSYDKTSLYEMSYAFMRRFAFVYIDAPRVPESDEAQRELIERYAAIWDIDAEPAVMDAIGDVWYVLNSADSERKIGPAVVQDMLSHASGEPPRSRERAITQAILGYVFPQLEGVRGREAIVGRLAQLDAIDVDRLAAVADDVLQVSLDG